MKALFVATVLALCAGCGTPTKRELPKEVRIEGAKVWICGIEVTAGRIGLSAPLGYTCLGYFQAIGCEYRAQEGRFGALYCTNPQMLAQQGSSSSFYFSYQSGPGLFGGPTFFFETMPYRPYPRACPPFGHQC